MIDLWLDDLRRAPDGWVHVKTVEEAQEYLRRGVVRCASLDHDLGACSRCYDGMLERWLEEHDHQSMPHCEHFGTGYSLVRWMEENDCWPLEKPTVHSANPDGRAKMKAVIEQKFWVTRSRDATSSGQIVLEPHPTPEQVAQKVVRSVQTIAELQKLLLDVVLHTMSFLTVATYHHRNTR
jgi:hypothetical protein